MRRKMRFIFPDIDKELYGKKLNSKLLFDCIWKMNPDMLFLMYGLMRDCS